MAVSNTGTPFSSLFCAVVGSVAMTCLVPCAIAQQASIPTSAAGKPDLSGIWQALNEANWNLEPHVATPGAVEALGAIGAVSPGIGAVVDGRIPYLPAAVAQRAKNHENRRTQDPEAKCFMPGVPRATYLPHPFQIVQSDGDIMIVYASGAPTPRPGST